MYAIMYIILYNFAFQSSKIKKILSTGKITVAFKREEEIMCIRLI